MPGEELRRAEESDRWEWLADGAAWALAGDPPTHQEGNRTMTDYTYRYDSIDADDLHADDLHAEAEAAGYGDAYSITLYDADGDAVAERAEALYFSDSGRCGIAWGGVADWTDADDIEDAIARWLNDEMVN